jgi:hypothetical protein
MGTWGAGIFDDDVAVDARGAFEKAVQAGLSPAQAASEVLDEMGDEAQDSDDGPVLILALASLLSDSGVRDHPLFEAAWEIIRIGAGLERWQDAGEAALAERQAVYKNLAAKLP